MGRREKGKEEGGGRVAASVTEDTFKRPIGLSLDGVDGVVWKTDCPGKGSVEHWRDETENDRERKTESRRERERGG